MRITASVDREAVEEAGASGADQVLLAAAAAGVRRVPRDVAAAGPIVMAELRGAGAVARPVLAGVIGAVGERGAIELGAGEHVVAIGRITDAVDGVALLGDRGDLREVVAAARRLERVAVEIRDVLGDACALGVVPRAAADAVARVHGWLAVRCRRAEIRVPRLAACTGGLRQRLTLTVRARQSAEVRAVAATGARDEERHRLGRLRPLRRRLPGGRGEGAA